MRASLLPVVVALGCRGGSPPLHPAGSDQDDGQGLLARASAQFLTTDDGDGLFEASRQARRDAERRYGGAAYGGAGYATYAVPSWPVSAPDRTPKHRQLANLSGAVEGVITWRGATPGELVTTCGAIEPWRIGADRAFGGVLVYIEQVDSGRELTHEGRPISVGGTVVKRGCTLAPTVQIVTPLPAALAIHGDAERADLRISTPAETLGALQAGGRIAVELAPGVTRVEAADGSLGAAWVHALDTPYYALTDDRGRYRIDELAAGTYELTFWQPPAPTIVGGALRYAAPVIVKRKVKIDTSRTTRLDLALGR